MTFRDARDKGRAMSDGVTQRIDEPTVRTRIRSFFTAFLVLVVVAVSFGQVASAQEAEPTPSEAPAESSPAPEGGSAEPSPAPTEPAVWTSKDDYVPAEVVDLNGAGWNPSESVELFVNDDEGKSW